MRKGVNIFLPSQVTPVRRDPQGQKGLPGTLWAPAVPESTDPTRKRAYWSLGSSLTLQLPAIISGDRKHRASVF